MAKSRKAKAKGAKTITPTKDYTPVWPFDARQTKWIYIGFSLFLTLILFSPYLFGSRFFIFTDVGSDTITVFFPNYAQIAHYFQSEGFPGWSFYSGLGHNIYPSYLTNPFHWPYLFLSPGGIAYAIGWVQAMVLFGTGLVFYFFLREAKFSLPVSFIGALIYAFGGYLVLGSTWYGHALVIFWMTLGIYGFELLLRRKIWWVLPIPFIFILGPRGYFLILFLALWALIRMVDLYGPSIKTVLQGYKRMIICGLVGLCFALPFIGGEFHRFAQSPRVTGKVSYSERLGNKPVFKLADARHNSTTILRLFSNNTVGAGNDYKGWRNYLEAPAVYMGLISLLLVFQFFVLAEKRRRWLYGALLGVWLFLILFPWFRFAFYGFAGDYYKGALSLFIPFSLLFVALSGLEEVIHGKRINLAMLLGSFVLLMTMLWYPYKAPQLNIQPGVQTMASAFLLGYGGLLALLSIGIGKKWILPALGLIVGIEGLMISWPTFYHRETVMKSDIADKKYHFDYGMDAVEYIKSIDDDPFYRIDKVYGSIKTGYNDGMVQDFFGSKSYQSHNSKYYVEFLDQVGVIDGSKEPNTRWLVGLSTTNILHGLFSIKYLLADNKTTSRVDTAIYDRIHRVGNVSIYKNRYYIPFGIPMDQYFTWKDFNQYSAGEKKRAFYFGALLEDGHPGMAAMKRLNDGNTSFYGYGTRDRTNALEKAAMKMEKFSHNHIIGSIHLDRPSEVFFSMPYDDGWRIKVNGKRKQLDMVNIGFMGVYLEAGDHVIDLYYVPPLSRVGWLGWIAGFLGIFLIRRFKDKF